MILPQQLHCNIVLANTPAAQGRIKVGAIDAAALGPFLK